MFVPTVHLSSFRDDDPLPELDRLNEKLSAYYKKVEASQKQEKLTEKLDEYYKEIEACQKPQREQSSK